MMFSTATKGVSTKTRTEVQWPKIFPEQITSYDHSMIFIKQLTMVALSTITFIKRALPASCFRVEQLGPVEVRLLKSSCDDELGNFLFRALTHAFEAFDSRFLEQLILCFYEEECKPENLVEFYVFEYDYTDDGGVSMSLSSEGNKKNFKCSMSNIKAQTMQMFQTCLVMLNNFRRLPENLDVSVRVYYNDKAPEGYQAPGFSSGSDMEDPMDSNLFGGYKLGAVKSHFHQLRVNSYVKDDQASHEAVASENTPEMTLSQTLEDIEPSSTTNINALDASINPVLNCVCSLTLLDWPTLTCHYCKTLQHAACYGVLACDVQCVSTHCCVLCASGHPARALATDAKLYEEPHKRQNLAIYRCTLAWCRSQSAVSAQELSTMFAMKAVSANKLMRLLANIGIVNDMDNGERKTINHAALSKPIQQQFRTFDDIAQGLLDETFASQEIPHDPIAQVLGPMKQVSLQNASNIGRVVPPQDNNNNDDPTLNQYKQAMQLMDSDNNMELLLSGSHNPVKDLENVGKKRKNNKTGNTVAPKRAKTVSKK